MLSKNNVFCLHRMSILCAPLYCYWTFATNEPEQNPNQKGKDDWKSVIANFLSDGIFFQISVNADQITSIIPAVSSQKSNQYNK